jgi:hypothetical protein
VITHVPVEEFLSKGLIGRNLVLECLSTMSVWVPVATSYHAGLKWRCFSRIQLLWCLPSTGEPPGMTVGGGGVGNVLGRKEGLQWLDSHKILPVHGSCDGGRTGMVHS